MPYEFRIDSIQEKKRNCGDDDPRDGIFYPRSRLIRLGEICAGEHVHDSAHDEAEERRYAYKSKEPKIKVGEIVCRISRWRREAGAARVFTAAAGVLRAPAGGIGPDGKRRHSAEYTDEDHDQAKEDRLVALEEKGRPYHGGWLSGGG